MKKKFLAILLAVVSILGTTMMASCGSNTDSSSSSSAPEVEFVDFASQLKLDMDSLSQKEEVTIKQCIDGDTTHFYFKSGNYPEAAKRDGFFKARYAACNTPESTGVVEPWGKTASKFTKNALTNAESIIIESEDPTWQTDSTGERYKTWVWYIPEGQTEYRNLNLELLQNGLARGSSASSSRYGDICAKALYNANVLELCVFNSAPNADPDFFYGKALEITLKELRTNLDKYVDKTVAFDATIAIRDNTDIYFEDYDAETGINYGINGYLGYNNPAVATGFMEASNRVRVVGTITNDEGFGPQISDMTYTEYEPNHPDNTQLIQANYGSQFKETSIETFNSNVTLQVATENEDGEEVFTEKTFRFGDLTEGSSISMTSLYVTGGKTSSSTAKSPNEMTLYCRDASGKTITLHTHAFRNKDGSYVTHADYVNKTINVRGIVSRFYENFQIEVFVKTHLTIVE